MKHIPRVVLIEYFCYSVGFFLILYRRTIKHIFHIHRAFLVNLNFITQVSGNAAGNKLQLFGSDKVLPVSKANVPDFRERVLDRQEE